MSENEKKLLKILLLVIVVIGFYFPIYISISSIKENKSFIDKYNKSIEQLIVQKEKLDSVQTDDKSDSEYEIIPLSEVTEYILKDMNKYGIIPERYQLYESNDKSYVDFNITCSTDAFVSYVTEKKNIVVPYNLINTSVMTNPGVIKASLRYTNENIRLSEPDNLLLKKDLIKHFPKIVKEKTLEKVTEVKLKEEPVIEDGNRKYKTVGYIEENGVKYLYIKTIETGKIIKIDSDKVEKTSDSVIVDIENKKIKLKK